MRKPRRSRQPACTAFVLVMLLLPTLALAACSGSGKVSTSRSTPLRPPSGASASASATVHVAYPIQVVRDVPYMSEPEGGKGTTLLDVYAPKDSGPWPLVVLLHGGGETKEGYVEWATDIAKRGAVVYVPTWSRMEGEIAAALDRREFRATLRAAIGDVAAAVRFARGTTADYGGDPNNLTLFGHSYGAMGATMDALGGAPPAESGLRGAGSTVPESLVVFDGDYLLASLGDDIVARDPGLMHVAAPWGLLGQPVDFPTTMIDSVTPDLSRNAFDAWDEGSWLDTRDPSGDLRRDLESMGAFDDNLYMNGEGMELLADRMRADGDTVTYITLTDSTHWELGPRGLESLLDALVPDAEP